MDGAGYVAILCAVIIIVVVHCMAFVDETFIGVVVFFWCVVIFFAIPQPKTSKPAKRKPSYCVGCMGQLEQRGGRRYCPSCRRYKYDG